MKVIAKSVETIATNGGRKTLVVPENAKKVLLKFDKSLAVYFGNIQMFIERDDHSDIISCDIPFARPSFTIPLPKILRNLNEGSHLEFWSKSTFRGNWRIDFELPVLPPGEYQATFVFELQPRFLGSKYERYWSGQASEKVTLEFR